MPSIEHLQSLTFDLPPCCMEFWPLDPQYAIVGTYNLEKTEEDGSHVEEPTGSEVGEETKLQQRNGSLILLRVDGDEVKILQTLSTPSAILDIHFHAAHPHQTTFGVATSTGSIGMYHLSLSPPSSDPQMIFDQTLQYFPEDILITAFQWHPNSTTIGMTLTNGDICLRTLEPEISLAESISGSVVTHDLEAWVLAFTPDGLGVYSGGDDSALKFTELAKNHDYYNVAEVEPCYGEVRRMPWSDRKIHGAGVTAILPFCSDDDGYFILTGSYDDHIRLIQAPVVGRRTVLAEMDLGGGVWRLKRLDTETSADDALIFASCMYAGARILSLKKDANGEWQFEVLAKFEEHKSMNYGSDCQPSLNKKGQRTFVTTSFYDRLLCLWQY